jgi:hypothetical protein
MKLSTKTFNLMGVICVRHGTDENLCNISGEKRDKITIDGKLLFVVVVVVVVVVCHLGATKLHSFGNECMN